jgi:hypothetical protein
LIIVRTERWLAAAALICGAAAWWAFFQRELILSHYDAKAHLVVARRVIDSLTPGWQQLGAVWLPLPHLLQLFPTQIDWLYRTGLFGSLVSLTSFAVSIWAAARLVVSMTGSAVGAVTAGSLLLFNPNLLYLQATPMTEPLLLATTLLVVLWTHEWLAAPRAPVAAGLPPPLIGTSQAGSGEPSAPTDTTAQPGVAPRKLAWAMAAAMWTRYEAWLIVAATLVIAALVMHRAGVKKPGFVRHSTKPGSVVRLARWPAAAVLIFVVNSRITVGAWFVSGGFYEPDPFYQDHVWRSLVAVWWGTHQLSGYAMTSAALLALSLVVAKNVRPGGRAARVVPAALFAAAALPFYAFYEGHPFRIRYMVPSVAASAVFCGIGVGSIRAPVVARVVGLLLVAATLIESPPWSDRAPMIEEAQWDVPRSRERRVVTACLAPAYQGDKVLASMGSLAHYMQELSREGFDIADFVHEGNGVIWQLAMETGPAPHAGWMLVEEQAEGGDVLAQRMRTNPEFARGMERVCEGGGVALYRRTRAGTARRDDQPQNVPTNRGDAEARSEEYLAFTAPRLRDSAVRDRLPPEPHANREVVGPAAEIDARRGEALVELALGAVIPDLPADAHRLAAEPQSAENDGAGRVAVGDELILEDLEVVAEVDELAELAVAPVDDAEAGTEVRLQRIALAERQHADRERQRHEPQSQVLLDLGSVRVDQLLIDARHGAAREADAGTRLEVLAQRHEPFPAD